MLEYFRQRTVIGQGCFLSQVISTEAPCAGTYTHGDWFRHVAVIDGAARTGQSSSVLVNAQADARWNAHIPLCEFLTVCWSSVPATDNFYRGVGKK